MEIKAPDAQEKSAVVIIIGKKVTLLFFDGAFGGDGEEDVVMGEGVVVTSSCTLALMLTSRCLGEMMVSLIFLEGLEEEA
ncbi:hypothetical protein Tco_1023119 [Tanacetum coccineum]